MENRRKKSISGEMFSLPSTPNQDQDSDFEFGCITPDSPSQDPSRNSPADHLFFNGRLLPHSFPCQQQPAAALISDNIDSKINMMMNISRVTSRTSSVSSKDSLMSSRSNSTNSRSSSCSSARTSSSDNSERRLLYYNTKAACRTSKASKIVTTQLYGSSQRWQHLTPVPALKREASQKNKNGGGVVLKDGLKRSTSSSSYSKTSQGKERSSASEKAPQGLCRRFFMSFLFACRECHAMEPSIKDDILQANLKI